jgi:DoxX-like family
MTRSAALRKTAYWASTGFAAPTLGATGAADLLRAAPIMENLARLGYPASFATILGAWELLGAAAIVAPDLPRVKEWAYAGMFFTLTGAALSHAVSGDSVGKVLVPLVVLGVVLVSWTLRPARRTLVVTEFAGRQAA